MPLYILSLFSVIFFEQGKTRENYIKYNTQSDKTKCWWGRGVTGTFSLLMEIQNYTAILKCSLAIPYRTKFTLIIWSNNLACWYLFKWIENLCPHKNLHTDVYSSFIHICQNLKMINVSFSRRMDKQTMGHSESREY